MNKNKIAAIFSTLFLGMILLSTVTITASYTKRDFVVNNDTKILLDIETATYYNGSISITVTEGPGINATVNSITQEILLDETKNFTITNTTTIYFEITSSDYVEGFFEMELNIDVNAGDRNPLTITVGILAAFLIILTVVSYYIRANRLKTKPDEDDEELIDPEVAKRRKEAAGAEKKYLGLDDKK